MKKALSIILSVIMAVSCFAGFGLTAQASDINTPATAPTIYAGTTTATLFSCGYPSGDYKSYVSNTKMFYRFVPATTNYYEFQLTGYESTVYAPGETPSVYIDIDDANGNYVNTEGYNQYNGITKSACKLVAGQVYYIGVSDYLSNTLAVKNSDYGYAEQTLYLTVTEHTHTFVTTSYSSFKVNECSTCDYYYYDYNVSSVGTVALSATEYTYNGKVQVPTVTAYDSNGNVIDSMSYFVSVSGNKKSVGIYTVSVQFGSAYNNASRTLIYTIKPKSTKITSAKASKKKASVKWKKVSGVTGYQVQYSTSKSFKSPKTLTVKGYKKTSKTVSSLKSKKKYYVRVRTYKTVKVNGKSTKLYSSWSSAKSVKVK